MTMFSMKPKFNLAEFLAESDPRNSTRSKPATAKALKGSGPKAKGKNEVQETAKNEK
ncbi:hypothetical protein QKW60_05045 [Defluviimonas aestuarii]|uniref:hypothetical protein n=1 Tax=Albidovulum aestuarii TaxID=1130726 RepID=UPI00249A952A|nr:hypothetical protein [Defluviimonas aestuarii]MDI3335760.1 hypothetical protein [Defluviimonas aestuarii]